MHVVTQAQTGRQKKKSETMNIAKFIECKEVDEVEDSTVVIAI